MNQGNVDLLAGSTWREPHSWPSRQPVTVVVPQGTTGRQLSFGQLERVSAEELDHALLQAIARDIDAGEGDEVILR